MRRWRPIPVSDDLRIISEATIDVCRKGLEQMRAARERLPRMTFRSHVDSNMRTTWAYDPHTDQRAAITHSGGALGTHITVSSVSNPNGFDTPQTYVALRGDALPFPIHPLSYRVSQDAGASLGRCLDRIIELLEVASDPSRRLPVERIHALRERLAAVAAMTAEAPSASGDTRTAEAFAASHDGPMTAYAVGEGTSRSRHFDLLTGLAHRRERLSDGFPPVMAVKNESNPGTSISLILRAPSVRHDQDMDPMERLRLLSTLPPLDK